VRFLILTNHFLKLRLANSKARGRLGKKEVWSGRSVARGGLRGVGLCVEFGEVQFIIKSNDKQGCEQLGQHGILSRYSLRAVRL
jgi:hypothetical protein